jgi:hypothetical protein
MWDESSIYPQVYITYNSEKFEPIKVYINGLFRFFSYFSIIATSYVFLLEWKIEFCIIGHFVKWLKFTIGVCCFIVQHFLLYK